MTDSPASNVVVYLVEWVDGRSDLFRTLDNSLTRYFIKAGAKVTPLVRQPVETKSNPDNGREVVASEPFCRDCHDTGLLHCSDPESCKTPAELEAWDRRERAEPPPTTTEKQS